jgi:hypothetical protein
MPKIRQITPRGLTYTDERGEERFIDFAECFERYVAEQTRPEGWERHRQLNPGRDPDPAAYEARLRRFRQVGLRNILGPPWGSGPFIELHTDPPTRFQFATEAEYDEARAAIERAGWRTADLS